MSKYLPITYDGHHTACPLCGSVFLTTNPDYIPGTKNRRHLLCQCSGCNSILLLRIFIGELPEHHHYGMIQMDWKVLHRGPQVPKS
jgi:hypothetical protein